MRPNTEKTAGFYDALSRGDVRRGIWGLESRFDPRKIMKSASVDRHFRRVVREYVRKEHRLLDVGCGPGGFTAVLAELSGNVTGLDVSEAWVESAQRTFREHALDGARAVLGTGERMPFEDASFDVVTLIDVLHHLDHPRAVLAEARRVLAPGGRLLVFEPNKLNPLLTFLCFFDRNEWGFLRTEMGILGAYERMLAPHFDVERKSYSGLLIGPDGPNARRLTDALLGESGEGPLAFLAPKVFLAARRR